MSTAYEVCPLPLLEGVAKFGIGNFGLERVFNFSLIKSPYGLAGFSFVYF